MDGREIQVARGLAGIRTQRELAELMGADVTPDTAAEKAAHTERTQESTIN